ncbi:hypothetical protein [Pontibacter sp. G13]|uniref:hypothetical protein n=1 Tax=Pontibacter sp. G13 TaxID=3074898 RepID=UPI00288AFA32|nr:hypothetical protein [Pontibacter sp. G13]WNJ20112.1 hypothetical protein RJD25_06470 [Pontibacter sp. G13]
MKFHSTQFLSLIAGFLMLAPSYVSAQHDWLPISEIEQEVSYELTLYLEHIEHEVSQRSGMYLYGVFDSQKQDPESSDMFEELLYRLGLTGYSETSEEPSGEPSIIGLEGIRFMQFRQFRETNLNGAPAWELNGVVEYVGGKVENFACYAQKNEQGYFLHLEDYEYW